MRRIRCSVAVFCWLVVVGLAPMAVQAQSKGLPAPSALLAFRPTLPGVDYDTPADQKAVDACKVELVTVQNRSIGYALRDGQGKMLRRFVANRRAARWTSGATTRTGSRSTARSTWTATRPWTRRGG